MKLSFRLNESDAEDLRLIKQFDGRNISEILREATRFWICTNYVNPRSAARHRLPPELVSLLPERQP